MREWRIVCKRQNPSLGKNLVVRKSWNIYALAEESTRMVVAFVFFLQRLWVVTPFVKSGLGD